MTFSTDPKIAGPVRREFLSVSQELAIKDPSYQLTWNSTDHMLWVAKGDDLIVEPFRGGIFDLDIPACKAATVTLRNLLEKLGGPL